MSGKLLARRLFSSSQQLMDYKLIPTTVFTPLEYGAVGCSEKDAIIAYGKDNIEVYHAFYKPLEYYLPQRDTGHCYIKMVSDRRSDRVISLHITGPNVGDILQGFAVAIK
jgi:thioredoxin reductase (NADPH)